MSRELYREGLYVLKKMRGILYRHRARLNVKHRAEAVARTDDTFGDIVTVRFRDIVWPRIELPCTGQWRVVMITLCIVAFWL